MRSAVAIVKKSAFATWLDHSGERAVLGSRVPIYTWDESHPALDAIVRPGSLYLVTERPAKQLWLVAVLLSPTYGKKGWESRVANVTPILDLTPIREALGFARLASPRTLDARQVAMLEHVCRNAISAHQFVASVPDRLLNAPPVIEKVTRPKLPKLIGELGTACLDQIEDVLDELRAKPERFLAKPGSFVTDVQSIYEGGVDKAEAMRLLRGELAPFAGRDRNLDKVAKRAIDELCRGMVALALERDADVPASCAKLRKPLARYAVFVKTMLAA